MQEQMLIVLGAADPVPMWAVVIGIVAAILIIIAAIFLIRGNSKKKGDTSGNATDWQSQAQAGTQGAAGAWNSQNPTGGAWGAQQQQNPTGSAWSNQQAPATVAANPWGNQQQSTPNPWGNQAQPPQPTANPWAAQQQSAANPWENPQQQSTANPWENPQQQPATNPWGVQQQQQQSAANSWAAQQPQQPAANSWGAQSPVTQAPATQDAWSQPQQAQQSWGAGGASTSSPLQSGTPSFGGTNPTGPSWGQSSQPDSWGASGAGISQQGQFAPASNQGAPGAPSWQQQPSGFGIQNNAGLSDNDKTILRPGGPSIGSGVGYVRVEEGKEPGRIYEIRKEALSIGRSRESDIFLEDLAVSRLHASIVNLGNGSYALKDEGSANGTKVNGQLVNKFQTHPLQEGDRIQLGQTVLVFALR
jgi:hypothetical protein